MVGKGCNGEVSDSADDGEDDLASDTATGDNPDGRFYNAAV